MVFCEGLSILKSLYDSYNSLDKKMELLNNFRIVINNDVSNASFRPAGISNRHLFTVKLSV